MSPSSGRATSIGATGSHDEPHTRRACAGVNTRKYLFDCTMLPISPIATAATGRIGSTCQRKAMNEDTCLPLGGVFSRHCRWSPQARRSQVWVRRRAGARHHWAMLRTFAAASAARPARSAASWKTQCQKTISAPSFPLTRSSSFARARRRLAPSCCRAFATTARTRPVSPCVRLAPPSSNRTVRSS